MMTHRNSFARAVGVTLLATALSGCNLFGSDCEKPEDTSVKFGSVATAPAVAASGVDYSNTELTLMATLPAGYSSVSTTVYGIKGMGNCIKSAEEFSLQVSARKDYPVIASCLPKDGGHAIARYECYKNDGGVHSCTLK